MLDLHDVTEQSLRSWRKTWKWSAGTHLLHLQLIKTFFRFAVRSNWITVSPAANLEAPKREERPTMPLSHEEMEALLEAAGEGTKEQALILLMHFSGLSIQDAVTLSHSAIDGHNLTLRRAKSGELVMTYLHPKVSEGAAPVSFGQQGVLLLDGKLTTRVGGEILASEATSRRSQCQGREPVFVEQLVKTLVETWTTFFRRRQRCQRHPRPPRHVR